MVIMWMRTEYGMDRKREKNKEKKGGVHGRTVCIHTFTSIILGIFIAIWLLRGLGYESYQILSGSMEPTLITGEIVLIDTNDQNVKTGDIIAFQNGSHVIIHRIVKTVSEGVYITKGDANSSEDLCPVEQGQILGTIWIKLGILTHFWVLFTSKKGALMAVGVITLLAICDTSGKRKGEGEIGYA